MKKEIIFIILIILISGRLYLPTLMKNYIQKITRTIKGKLITRNGSKENPAYIVKSEAGNIALKLGTELSKA